MYTSETDKRRARVRRRSHRGALPEVKGAVSLKSAVSLSACCQPVSLLSACQPAVKPVGLLHIGLDSLQQFVEADGISIFGTLEQTLDDGQGQ